MVNPILVTDAENEQLIPWAAQRVGVTGFRRDARAIGLLRGGEISAVVVYDTFSDVDCHVHLASDGTGKWLTRGFLTAGFSYPFIQCGFESITGIAAADNEEALRLNAHFGYERVGVRRKAMTGGRDAVIFEMMRDTCRFIPKEFRNG